MNGVAVEPDCWGQGIARHLLELLTNHRASTAYTKLQLYVDQDNARARELCELNGWALTGESLPHERVPLVRYDPITQRPR